ncbi:MAG TPA: hypothetical protein QF353_02315 [Gammaproteobacteria bacterium]|nr:hypothetical protein [Gammaproteobacteria bacterium]
MKDSNKKSSGVEETKNQEESKDKEGSISSNQDQPESALQNLVETGEDGGPIKKVKGYATLKDLAMLARVNKRFQSAMNKEIKQRELFIYSIFTGSNHTMVLVKIPLGENKLFASGDNSCGQLGLGNPTARHEWTEVDLPKDFMMETVIVGGAHGFLKGKGVNGEAKLYAVGGNMYGQLGLGNTMTNINENEWTALDIPQGFRLEQVIAGGAHSFLKGKGKDGEGKIYACGANRYGQLGLGDTDSRDNLTKVTMPEGFKLEQVIAEGYHSFLKGKGSDGEQELYTSGWNKDGQLGLGDTTNRNEWTAVDIPPGFRLEKIIVGHYHSVLIGKGVNGEGKIYACGANRYGQLGLGDTTNRDKWTEVTLPDGFKIEKVIAGGDHSFLKGTVDGEAKLYACGDNQYGQLGLGHSEPRPPFEQGLTRQQMIDIPDTYSAYLQGDNKGRNKFTEVPLPKEFTIEKVIAGDEHSFLKGKGNDGEDKLYATGHNGSGQLGLGDTTNRHEWTEVPIRNRVLKSIVSQEEASMNKKRSGGK